MRVDVKPVAKLSDDERAVLKALTAAVYPPEVSATSPGRHLTWASPDYSVLVSTPEGELVSHVGIVVRAGILDGAPVKIGGVGSVKTHPRAEGRGYASAGLAALLPSFMPTTRSRSRCWSARSISCLSTTVLAGWRSWAA